MDINSVNIEEFETLAQVMDDEVVAHIINDEITAHVIDDEITAHKMNEPSTEALANAANALGITTTINPSGSMSMFGNEAETQSSEMQERMRRFMASLAGHQPGDTHTLGSINYTVQDKPHRGMWMKDKSIELANPNMKNNSVRRKLAKRPKKYSVTNL